MVDIGLEKLHSPHGKEFLERTFQSEFGVMWQER